MRGRSLARIAVAAQAVLLAGALIVPSVAAAATFGFTLNAPTLSTVQYSDFTDLRGSYTCADDGVSNCPTSVQNLTATFSVRESGGSTFQTVGTVISSFNFTGTSCPTTCTFNFSLTWKAGLTDGGPVPPGVYDIGLATTIGGPDQVLLGGVTVTQESTTTTYAGDTFGAADTDITLGATVRDQDLGLEDGTGVFFPDANLFGFEIAFELFDSTNTTSVAGPVGGLILSNGTVFPADVLHLPSTGGTYKLRTTYAGNMYYASSSDLTTIDVSGGGTGTNTPPVLVLPGTVTAEATSLLGANVDFVVSATDAEDDPDPTPVCDHASGSLFAIGDTTVECTVTDSGGESDTDSFTVSVVDTTDPVVTISTTESDNGAGWYNIASNDGVAGLTVDVSATDAVGPTLLQCTDNGVSVGALPSTGGSFVLGDGSHAIACHASDFVGNVGDDSASFDVDQTAPTSIAFTGGGLTDGGVYVFGSVPEGPTGCTADGGPSGLDSCDVSGYSNLVGDQAVTAIAIDGAGNEASADLSYTVLAWSLIGFGSPISMDSVNEVKGGSSVNVKFEVFIDGTEQSDLGVVTAFLQTPVTCALHIPLGPSTDATSSKGNGLRYDTNSGQYLTKWDAPTDSGSCWLLTLVTADGSTLQASFVIK